MTDPQIRYRQLVETTRHNREQEDNWLKSLGETIRHDQAQEQLSKYQADTSAAATRYSADQRADSSRYSADVSSSTSSYKSELEHLDRQQRLDFDKVTQRFQNELAAAKTRIDRMMADSNVMRNDTEIAKVNKQIEQIAKDMVYQAKQYHLNEMETEANVALKRAQTLGAAVRAGKDLSSAMKDLSGLASSLAGLI